MLDHVELLRRAPKFRLCVEIGRVHYERVTFPVTDGIAEPLANARGPMLRSHPYDADLMHILRHDHDVLRSLHNLVAHKVRERIVNRWSSSGCVKATFGDGPILYAVEAFGRA